MAKQLLLENVSFSPDQIKNLKLNENIQDIPKNCIAAYKVPISVCDRENLNGRVYSKNLWLGVISRGEGNDFIGLLDHPETDNGSIKDVAATYRNMRIEGNTVYADMYLIGDNGKYINDLIQAGNKVVGLSTVGTGEYISGTRIIDPNTFKFERCDLVLNPSAVIHADSVNQIETNNLRAEEVQKQFKTEHYQIMECVKNESYTTPLKRKNTRVVEYITEQSRAFKIVRDNRLELEQIRSYPEAVKKVTKLKHSIVEGVLS